MMSLLSGSIQMTGAESTIANTLFPFAFRARRRIEEGKHSACGSTFTVRASPGTLARSSSWETSTGVPGTKHGLLAFFRIEGRGHSKVS